jgi:penicillin-binding protein 2
VGLALKDTAGEARLVRNRSKWALGIVVSLTLVLAARLIQLQVIEHEHFQTLSHDNRVKLVPLAPTRGLIFDRNGVVLAQNVPSHSLELVPEGVKDIDSVVAELKTIVAMTPADDERFRELLERKPNFQSIPLKVRLSEEEVARFAVNRHRFPGVDTQARLARHYPRGALAVHAIGYVARLNEAEMQRVDAANYRGTTHIGKVGIEQAYERLLHGQVGFQHVETNAQGRTLRVLDRSLPTPGADLYLTIDVSLQATAEAALGGENGAVVAIDPRTGEVLALASSPGFDPNLFVNGIDPAAYEMLSQSPERPLFNRPILGQYPPGSTIKPFIAVAALERNVAFAREEIWCPGWYQLKGHAHRYRDWKRGGHGQVDMHRAIVESCDVYFYELARALGIERMHEAMTEFGFGRRTGIDLNGEVAGLMPSAAWKRRTRGQPWFPGETLITGIGQGFFLVTPLQLATATATLAMGGKRLAPRLVRRIDDPSTADHVPAPVMHEDVAVSMLANWRRVVSSMVDVVHGPRGTARASGADASYAMAGKTGTAQVFAVGQDEEYEEEKVDKKLRDHGLFVAFAPADEPRIVVTVVVENGGSGSRSAAPLARQIIDHFLLRGRPRDPARVAVTSLGESQQGAQSQPATGFAARLTQEVRGER